MAQKVETGDLIDKIRESEQESEFRIFKKHSAIPHVPILQRWKQVQVCYSREEVARYFEQHFGRKVHIANEITTRKGTIYSLCWHNPSEMPINPIGSYNYTFIRLNPSIV